MCKLLPIATVLLGAALLSSAFANAAEAPEPNANESQQLSSLIFSPSDVTNLLKVMRAKELNEGNPLDALSAGEMGDADILEEIKRREMKEQEARSAETTLPDVYVSSIVYRSPKDWTVWLRKHMFEPVTITPAVSTDKNAGAQSANIAQMNAVDVDIEAENTSSEMIVLTAANPKGDFERMQIVDITKDHVTLKYSPDAGAIAQKRYQTSDQITPRLERFMNRVSNSTISYDATANVFTVLLKANQTFSLNMMRVVEGRTVAKVTKASKAEAIENSQGDAAQKGAASPDDVDFQFTTGGSLEADAANKLINDLQKVQKFLPTNQMK